MRIPRDLYDWFSAVVLLVVDKKYEKSLPLSPLETLIYELWVLDLETGTGGLSQYFRKCGLQRWNVICTAANVGRLSSFTPFASAVNGRLAGAINPSEALLKSDDLYYSHLEPIIRELRVKLSE